MAATRDFKIKMKPKAEPESNKIYLVIGNGEYDDMALANATNDADGISAALTRCGFQGETLLNVNKQQMEEGCEKFFKILFSRRVTCIFFFAGHALQIDGVNYLVPLEASCTTKSDVPHRCLSLDWVVAKIGDANEVCKGSTAMLLLDCCRNNPFKTKSAFRSLTSSGLAPVAAQSGMLIAFATAPGMVASDGDPDVDGDGHGLYTSALLKHLETPGLELSSLFRKVRGEVQTRSNEQQTPWEHTCLVDDFYFVPAGDTPAQANEAQEAKKPVASETNAVLEGLAAMLAGQMLAHQQQQTPTQQIDVKDSNAPPLSGTAPAITIEDVDEESSQPTSTSKGANTADAFGRLLNAPSETDSPVSAVPLSPLPPMHQEEEQWVDTVDESEAWLECGCRWCRLPTITPQKGLSVYKDAVFLGDRPNCKNLEKMREILRAYKPGVRSFGPNEECPVPYLNILFIGGNGMGKSATINNCYCATTDTGDPVTVDFCYSISGTKMQNVTNQLRWIPVEGTKIRLGDCRGLGYNRIKKAATTSAGQIKDALAATIATDMELLTAMLEGRIRADQDIYTMKGKQQVLLKECFQPPREEDLPTVVVFVNAHRYSLVDNRGHELVPAIRAYISRIIEKNYSPLQIFTGWDLPFFKVDGRFPEKTTLREMICGNTTSEAMLKTLMDHTMIKENVTHCFANPVDNFSSRRKFSDHAVLSFMMDCMCSAESKIAGSKARLLNQASEAAQQSTESAPAGPTRPPEAAVPASRSLQVNSKQQLLNAEKAIGKTIFVAAETGDLSGVQYLLGVGADINHTRVTDGATILHLAAGAGYDKVVTFALEERALLETKDKNGNTPLLKAVSNGHHNVSMMLIDAGAKLDATNDRSEHALSICAANGKETICKALLDKGCDPNFKPPFSKRTALSYSAEAGFLTVTKLLLDSGADVHILQGRVEDTALTLAAANGHIELCQVLIGAGCNVNYANKNKKTALMLANGKGHAGVSRILAMSGANMPSKSCTIL